MEATSLFVLILFCNYLPKSNQKSIGKTKAQLSKVKFTSDYRIFFNNLMLFRHCGTLLMMKVMNTAKKNSREETVRFTFLLKK